jgi:hypothetical protein
MGKTPFLSRVAPSLIAITSMVCASATFCLLSQEVTLAVSDYQPCTVGHRLLNERGVNVDFDHNLNMCAFQQSFFKEVSYPSFPQSEQDLVYFATPT